jgi:hypothetical protein
MTILDNNQTIAWQNALTRVIKALDANEQVTITRPSLSAILAEANAE